MFCPFCGKEVKEGYAFCAGCGKSVAAYTAARSTENAMPKAATSAQPPVFEVKTETPVQPFEPVVEQPVEEAPAFEPAVEKPVQPFEPVVEQPVEKAPAFEPAAPVEPAPFAPVAEPVTPAPAFIPVTPPPVRPAPVVRKTAKPTRTEPLITAATCINIGLCLLLTALYAGICAVFYFLMNMEETIAISSVFAEEVVGHMTLQEFITFLKEGGRQMHPTMLSTVLGWCISLFVYAVPFFGVLALICAYTNKKATATNTAFFVISTLAALCVAIIPLLAGFIPGLKQNLTVCVGLLTGDLDKVTNLPLILYGGLVIVLTAITAIVTASLRKRRSAA